MNVICTVELGPAVSSSDAAILTVAAQLFLNGALLVSLTNFVRDGTTFTFTHSLDSFEMENAGEYMCTATVSPPQSPFITPGNETLSGSAMLAIGEN